MIEINWHPSRKELNVFAGLWCVFFALVAFAVFRRFESLAGAATVFVVAMALVIPGLWSLPWLRSIYLIWTLATYPIGWIVSHVVLAIVFFGVVTPVGLLLRVFGRDPMCRRREPQRESYWEARTPRDDVNSYFKQF